MHHDEALEALNTPEALQQKFTGKQFVALALATLAAPLIILVIVGSTL